MKYICILLFLFSSLLAKAQQLAGFKPNESTRLVLSVSKPSKSKTSIVVKKIDVKSLCTLWTMCYIKMWIEDFLG